MQLRILLYIGSNPASLLIPASVIHNNDFQQGKRQQRLRFLPVPVPVLNAVKTPEQDVRMILRWNDDGYKRHFGIRLPLWQLNAPPYKRGISDGLIAPALVFCHKLLINSLVLCPPLMK